MQFIVEHINEFASITIIVQWVAPGVVAIWAFKKRHPIVRHGKKFFRKED